MSVTKLSDPLPKVHQCGCGSQAFHLCEDGRVVCLQCRYVIEPLSVMDSRVAEPASLGAEALETAVCNVLHKALAGYDDSYKHAENGQIFIKWGAVERDIKAIIRKHQPIKAGWVSIPESALRWLFGEEGEFTDPNPPGRFPRRYWWRSEFRKRAGLAAAPVDTGEDEHGDTIHSTGLRRHRAPDSDDL